MTWFPACSGSEEEGPNFSPPVMGPAFQRGQRRLLEAQAFDKVQREAREFHERKAKKYGVDHPVGLAHYKAARSYQSREAAGRLQEMFENGGQIGELPPSAIIKANKAAIGFHKKQAEKAGLDSDAAHAHTAAMEHHMDILNKAKAKQKEAMAGHSGKQSPVPVPKKSDQPSEDVRQNLPPVPLRRLQQKKQEAIDHFGEGFEGGPGSGPHKASGRSPKEIQHDMHRAMNALDKHRETKPNNHPDVVKANKKVNILASELRAAYRSKSKEAAGPDSDTTRHNPNSDRHIMKPNLVWRDKKPRPAKYGPKAAPPRPADAANQRESFRRRSLRRG